MKKEDVDKFRKELNDDIDKIIEDDESEKEVAFFKPSHLFLTISIVCLVFAFVFGYIKLKGLCIFVYVIRWILFFIDGIEIPKKPKKDTDKILMEDEFEEAFKR